MLRAYLPKVLRVHHRHLRMLETNEDLQHHTCQYTCSVFITDHAYELPGYDDDTLLC
jgi:hypothetical protein